MGLFDGISFEWDGKPVTIPPDRLLGALARLEERVSLTELLGVDGTKPGPIADALLAILRHAGAEMDDGAVYGAVQVDPAARSLAYAAIEALVESTARPGRTGGKGNGAAPSSRQGLVEGLYKAIVGRLGLAPRDFWSLTPCEAWWLVEARTPPKHITPNMTEDEADAIYREAYGTEDDE